MTRATYESVRSISLEAGADFSTTGQNRFGTVGSDGKVELAALDAVADGVILNDPLENNAVEFGIGGVVPLVVGTGGLTAGQLVKSGANGTAVLRDGTTPILGRALETGVAGAVIPVLLYHG